MIVFTHLLNDRSGSPKVLKNTIHAVAALMEPAILYVGSQGYGVLSDCGIPIKKYWYWRTGNKLGTLATYLFSQLVLFFRLLFDRDIDRNAVIYVNTLLPFGAAVYGWLTCRKVIYHVHEITVTPAPLKWMLVSFCKLTSHLNIYVSDAHVKALPIPNVPFKRIYNALDANFTSIAYTSVYKQRRDGIFNVLMITSLRTYKGVAEFLSLAVNLISCDDIRFDLVLNDDNAAIKQFFVENPKPNNLNIHGRQTDMTPYYSNASLVVNLSRPDLVIETFGLTILEAMAFGIPVIVPPVGGPAELVTDGQQGFLIDCREIEKLVEKVRHLADDEALCMRLSAAARSKAAQFSSESFAQGIRDALDIKPT